MPNKSSFCDPSDKLWDKSCKTLIYLFFYFSLAGVGKSSLVHLLCQNQVLGNPSWTVGCSVDVRVNDHFTLLTLISRSFTTVPSFSNQRSTTIKRELRRRRPSTLSFGTSEGPLEVPAASKAPERSSITQLMVT